MKLTLIDKKRQTKDVTTFIFKSDKPVKWLAGQFLFYTFPHKNPDTRGVTRYFTISSAPFEKNIMITTRFANEKSSSFKKALFTSKLGTTIEASDPDGDFIVEDPNKNSIFISGGIGITPYHSILLDLDYKNLPINVTLLYANHDNDFVFKKELEAIATKHPNFRIKYFVSPRHIEWEDIDKAQKEIGGKPIIYVSGPEPMVEAFEKTLKDHRVSKSRIKLDFFPGYEIIK